MREHYTSQTQALAVIVNNPKLIQFHLTPRWTHNYYGWINLYNEYFPKIQFGQDLINLMQYVKYKYSSLYNNMYKHAAQMASMDLVDSDCSTIAYLTSEDEYSDKVFMKVKM